MGKVVLFSSDGYQGSSLEELINYSWNYPKLKRLHFSEVDNQIQSQTIDNSKSLITKDLKTQINNSKNKCLVFNNILFNYGIRKFNNTMYRKNRI